MKRSNRKTVLMKLLMLVLVSGMIACTQTKKEPMDKKMKMHAPIPQAAFGPTPSKKGYHVEEIGSGLYWVTEGVYQVMFLTTGEGVIVVDAPPNIGKNILAAIKETTDEPITHVIYSHAHADHLAAASMYPKDAIYIAHEATATRLSQDTPFPYGQFVGGGPVPPPTVTFDDTYTLVVGNQILELAYNGPAHIPGNLFIYAPKQKVLMVIDVIFPGWTPFKWLAVAETVPAFVAAHDWILSYEFETLISGHVGRLGTRKDVEVQKEYILDIQTNAAKAMQIVDFNAIAKKVGYSNIWLLFDTYLNAVDRKCAEMTEKKWIGKLAAVDVFTLSHCEKMVESLRID
ncbi:MAG: MBL fold metallo-hydrolase [SAR324 cluster bacterium]|uniref:MBL fold metallo-hydrolase n=1 Tax=SAR324 cluster bacterium TaxID=2024889 RepID=A0A2A4T433_9DELT|nr:MAG: MBL fold metallo-hydrolase [SAR324 cluster bacterium]